MIQKPKGTADILPSDIGIWQYVEGVARKIFKQFGYAEIRTPMFEQFELFHRSVGESSDIVTKEMYDFKDKGDRHLALKPEGTAPIVRAFVENKLYGPEYPKPYKVYYISPFFRYERPQSGRQRQFHQIGVESFGVNAVTVDAEIIAMAWEFLKRLGLKDLELHINSLGDEASRQRYREALIAYFKPLEGQLSEDSRNRLEVNPLRILDSKDEADKKLLAKAPKIEDYLSQTSKDRFERLKNLLDILDIPYMLDPNLVRGLDYYQETIFEIIAHDEVFNGELTVCGGGNYEGLVEEVSEGKDDSVGFGFGIGFERLLLLMQAQKVALPEAERPDLYIVGIGEETEDFVMKLLLKLRRQGIIVERDFLNRKAKKQFREADRLGAQYVLVIGSKELESGQLTLKEMSSGEESPVALENFCQEPKNYLK